jgi:hypothetical protein
MNFPQLVKFDNDWADEFSLTTFAVIENQEVERLFNLVELYFSFFPGKIIEMYFGTNEFFEFEDYKSFRNSFEIVNLTEQEVEMFRKLFPPYGENPVEFGNNFLDGVFIVELFLDHHKFVEKLSEEQQKQLVEIEPEFEEWLSR